MRGGDEQREPERAQGGEGGAGERAAAGGNLVALDGRRGGEHGAGERADQRPQQPVAERLADRGVDVAGQQRRDDHEEREQQRADARYAEPQAEARALEPGELRPGEVERGERGHEREEARRDAAGAAEDLEQRVVLEAREHKLHHLPERLLEVAGVGAEEADQRCVRQRGEDEAGEEHDREGPEPDHPGGDDSRRLPELPELAHELRSRVGGAGARRFPFALALGFGFRLRLRLGFGLRLGFRLRSGPRLGLGLRGQGRGGGGSGCGHVRGLRGCGARAGGSAVGAEARALFQPLAALVAERHPASSVTGRSEGCRGVDCALRRCVGSHR